MGNDLIYALRTEFDNNTPEEVQDSTAMDMYARG